MTLPLDPALLRDPGQVVPFDRLALARHLAAMGHTVEDGPVRQFAGGYGNLNYLIRVDGHWAVLRRPPLGEIPKGANDMARNTARCRCWRRSGRWHRGPLPSARIRRCWARPS